MTEADRHFGELPSSLRWLDRPPLGLATGLRGHIVALVSWRLGCVHSRQALAELASLQREFAERAFALIAVHTPIAPGEADLARLRRALAERTVPVTVAVDVEHELLRRIGHRFLPGLVLIDVDGTVRFRGHGEPNLLRVADAIESMLQNAERDGVAARVPFVPSLPTQPIRLTPRAIAADGETLWVAAAGHRRVYQVDRTGRVLRTIGSGQAGTLDGAPTVASLHTPMGLAVHGEHVLVADVGAHALRAIDRTTGEVSTWCGNGRRSTDRIGGGFGTAQGLCSPVALCALDGGLLFSQAGAHQLWQIDPQTQGASSWLGTGARSLRDGGEEATFAEPWGIAVGEHVVFVADAANGALRSIDRGHNFVRTVRQGLLRPSGVALRGTEVFVVDSWQPAVLRWTQGDATVTGREERIADGNDGLEEPSAIAVREDELWLADAAADCLFVSQWDSRTWRRIEISGCPQPPACACDPRFALLAESVTAPQFCDVTFRIELPTAAGDQLDPTQPCEVDLLDEGARVLACDRNAVAEIAAGAAVILVPIGDRGRGALRVRVQANVREGPAAAPRRHTWRYVVPIEVTSTDVVAGEPAPEVLVRAVSAHR